MGLGSTSVIQVTNIAPTVTNEQLRTLLSFVGTIREFVVYPSHDPSLQISRICYVKYIDNMSVAVAQHLTNTVFIDRSILVKPLADGNIPDESMALKLANEDHSQNSSNSGVVSQIATANGIQSITTIDPRLNALGLPQYPPLPANMDPSKIEEIRRTISVNNVSQFTTPEDLLEFFTQFGEVKYLRMTSNECDVIKSALIEFTDQSSVANALQNTGVSYNGSQLNISHSTTNILKSQSKSNDLEKFPDTTIVNKHKEPSRSPSRKRSRSVSRRRSRERRRSVSRSKSRERRRRSRSRDRRRSPSPISKDRLRERSKRDRPRERGWERSRDRSVERDRDRRRSRDRDRRRDRSRERTRDRERNRERSRGRDSERTREIDRKERHRSKRDKERRRSRSHSKDKREVLDFPLSKSDMDVCLDDKRIIDAETSSIKSERSSSHQKSLSPQLSSSRPKSYHKKDLKLERDYESEDEKYSI